MAPPAKWPKCRYDFVAFRWRHNTNLCLVFPITWVVIEGVSLFSYRFFITNILKQTVVIREVWVENQCEKKMVKTLL